MKFNEIRNKIKNLGNFKSVKEIKKAGLRVVYNRKDDSYWLIEKDFLKPVIKSPRECKSILIKEEDLKYKVFMCHKSRKELKGTKALEYIKWGEEQGYHKRPTCASREKWWDLNIENIADDIFIMIFNDIFRTISNNLHILTNNKLYEINFFQKLVLQKKSIALNNFILWLFVELLGRSNLAEGARDLTRYEVSNLMIVNPEIINRDCKNKEIYTRDILPIFEELGFDKNKPIREQEPNPLPDRKALDDIVFDALGLTKQERKEVYWAVAELVKNRLEKAKSV